MSCTICRLPYIPGPMSINSASSMPPDRLLSSAQVQYFQNAWLMGKTVMGVIQHYEYNNNNVFGGSPFGPLIPTVITWQTASPEPEGSLVTCHEVCTALFWRRLGAEGETILDYAKILSVEATLGQPGINLNAGRFPGVDHESAGEKIDLRPFWRISSGPEVILFDYKALDKQGLSWLLTKPNTFPRFYPTVAEKRLAPTNDPVEQYSVLVNLLLDLIVVLAGYLDPKSFVKLISTCRLLRRHALIKLQSVAREIVLSLPGSIATETELLTMAAATKEKIALKSTSPLDGDWILYLSRIHRTTSMRVRRHIYAQADKAVSLYEQKRPEDPVEQAKALEGLKEKIKGCMQ